MAERPPRAPAAPYLEGFLRQPHRPAKGRVGEDAAVDWLVGQGYRVLERNVRTPLGEIDLIASEGEVLAFVEIKARGSARYGRAIEAVTPRKQRRLARCAAWWLASRGGPDGPCRFDVVGLDRGKGGWTVELVRGAFEA